MYIFLETTFRVECFVEKSLFDSKFDLSNPFRGNFFIFLLMFLSLKEITFYSKFFFINGKNNKVAILYYILLK